MYLHSLHLALPPASYTQPECWEILQRCAATTALTQRSRSILRKVLLGDSGIDKRHFALDDFDQLFKLDAEGLHNAFARTAPELATQAASQALEKAQLRAADCDALFICTCTGYLCPGLSSYVAEALGMPNHAYLQDLVGLGCGAALPTLRSAAHFLAAHPSATVCMVAVEVCSAAFYLDNDPGVLISLCLFGDGAVAAVLSARSNKPAQALGRFSAFDTLHLPQQRELLRFENSGGKLRNKLDKTVPQSAAAAVRTLYARRSAPPPANVIAHTGGRDVLAALEEIPTIPTLSTSRRTLALYGNMSSPSVLAALDLHLQSQPQPRSSLWLTSFGAGFSAHSCQFNTTTEF